MTLPEKYRADRLTDYYQVNLRLMSPWQVRALRVQVNGSAAATALIDEDLERRRVSDLGADERLSACVKDILEGVGK